MGREVVATHRMRTYADQRIAMSATNLLLTKTPFTFWVAFGHRIREFVRFGVEAGSKLVQNGALKIFRERSLNLAIFARPMKTLVEKRRKPGMVAPG